MTSSATALKDSLSFTDLLPSGQGVARDGARVVFCFGVLPGEKARVRITTAKKTYAVAELVEIEEYSPERVDPFCPFFGACGGCQAQHLSYPAQLRWKRRMVENALQRIGGIRDVAVRETIGMAQPRAYRNKVSLVVEHESEGERIGFYRFRSHEVVAIDGCPVAKARLSEYMGILASAPPESAVGEALHEARHVVARSDEEGGAVLSVTTAHRSERLAAAAPALLAALPGAKGIVNSYEPRSENAVLGRKNVLLCGEEQIDEEIAGLRFRVSPASFFQVNGEILERIFGVARQELLPVHRAVDLYCGIGTFTLFFAREGAEVIGVEEHVHAAEEARANAQLNGVERRTRFRAVRVEEWSRSREGVAALAEADLVFLDPPRKGSDEATLRAICKARSPRIGYLSCDPATLARDLRLLVANGYRITNVTPFDMFPQTGHVETLVTLAAL